MSAPLNNSAQQIRASIEKLAPRWVAPPVLQPAALYLELSGEDIRRRAFLIADDAGELCLRPDMTVPALRAALDAGETQGLIAYEGLVFRRQPRKSARETEFLQIGAEWLGPSDDAEIIVAALEACRAGGAEPLLRLGDLALVDAFVESCGIAAPWVARVKRALHRTHGLAALKAELAEDTPSEGMSLADALAALPEAEAEAALADLLALSNVTPVGARSLGDVARRLRARGEIHRAPKPPSGVIALLDEIAHIDAPLEAGLAAVKALLADKRVSGAKAKKAFELAEARVKAVAARAKLPNDARFAPGLGRGLAYYDGFVFELEAPALGEEASLGGGGRYDGLARALADRDIAGAGFALRPARIERAAR